MSVLIDTSVWSLGVRRKAADLNISETSIVNELRELVTEGRARLIGPIRQELLAGIKTTQQYAKLRSKLRSFPDVPIDTSNYETAAKWSNACRAKGIAVSPVDALICVIALDRSFSIFTTDPDFLKYAKVLPIPLHLPRNKALTV